MAKWGGSYKWETKVFLIVNKILLLMAQNKSDAQNSCRLTTWTATNIACSFVISAKIIGSLWCQPSPGVSI